MKTINALLFTIIIVSAACHDLKDVLTENLVDILIKEERYNMDVNDMFLHQRHYMYASEYDRNRLIQEINKLIEIGGEKVKKFVQKQIDSTFLKYPLKEVLSDFTKEELMIVASKLENHIGMEKTFLGGITDYASSLNESELIEALSNFSVAWGDYRNVLVSIAKSINQSKVDDYLTKSSLDYLKKLSIALEKYNNKVSDNENSRSSIEDKMKRTSDIDDVIYEINRFYRDIQYKDRDFPSKLDKVEFEEELVNSKILSQEEVSKYLNDFTLDQMVKFASVTDSYLLKYSPAKKEVEKDDDKPNTIRAYMIDYILAKSRELPLISTMKFLD